MLEILANQAATAGAPAALSQPSSIDTRRSPRLGRDGIRRRLESKPFPAPTLRSDLSRAAVRPGDSQAIDPIRGNDVMMLHEGEPS